MGGRAGGRTAVSWGGPGKGRRERLRPQPCPPTGARRPPVAPSAGDPSVRPISAGLAPIFSELLVNGAGSSRGAVRPGAGEKEPVGSSGPSFVPRPCRLSGTEVGGSLREVAAEGPELGREGSAGAGAGAPRAQVWSEGARSLPARLACFPKRGARIPWCSQRRGAPSEKAAGSIFRE